MDKNTRLALVSKIMGLCSIEQGNEVYALLPELDSIPQYYKNIYFHNVYNIPKIIDSAVGILNNKNSKNSRAYEAKRITEEKESLLKEFSEFIEHSHIEYSQSMNNSQSINNNKSKTIKIGDNAINASLAMLLAVYFKTFATPLQLFIPNSYSCCAQWSFWEKIDYLRMLEELSNKKVNFELKEKILQSRVWNEKAKLKSFPLVVQRRIIKENLLEKKMDAKSMIKALIIRFSEMGRPTIPYETTDIALRTFFRYYEINEYIRCDIELDFLKRLEEEIVKKISECMGSECIGNALD